MWKKKKPWKKESYDQKKVCKKNGPHQNHAHA